MRNHLMNIIKSFNRCCRFYQRDNDIDIINTRKMEIFKQYCHASVPQRLLNLMICVFYIKMFKFVLATATKQADYSFLWITDHKDKII